MSIDHGDKGESYRGVKGLSGDLEVRVPKGLYKEYQGVSGIEDLGLRVPKGLYKEYQGVSCIWV